MSFSFHSLGPSVAAVQQDLIPKLAAAGDGAGKQLGSSINAALDGLVVPAGAMVDVDASGSFHSGGGELRFLVRVIAAHHVAQPIAAPGNQAGATGAAAAGSSPANSSQANP